MILNCGNDIVYVPYNGFIIAKVRGGDVHFRAANCKHQVAVRSWIASQVQIISPPDFGYYEAVVGNITNVIATIEYHSDRDCDQPHWSVRMAKE
ncbi:MAG: hypothetical protein ACKPEQ_14500, partial [Dolichospermum sp.]